MIARFQNLDLLATLDQIVYQVTCINILADQ